MQTTNNKKIRSGAKFEAIFPVIPQHWHQKGYLPILAIVYDNWITKVNLD